VVKIHSYAIAEFLNKDMKIMPSQGNGIQVTLTRDMSSSYFATTDALVDFLEYVLDECKTIQRKQHSGEG